MTPERWQRIEELFHAASELEGKERDSFLSERCAGDTALRSEVEKLLDQLGEADSFIERPFVDSTKGGVLASLFDETDDDPMTGAMLGSYRIEREIGRGGMGAVYEASRADGEFDLKVAIKIVKRGIDTDFVLRRFRNERQILAALDHPFITRLIDGGSTADGRPYFVMDLIEGLPLYKFADSGRKDIPERLRLFCRVCEAVEYAHQRRVIHRDLKPSNIFVTADGSPRLLDFGIAKLLDPELSMDTLQPTATSMRMMTVDYASPEQIRGESIDFTSDVYSLGVILFELLSGRRPFEIFGRDPQGLARAICDEDPPGLCEAFSDDGHQAAGSKPSDIKPTAGQLASLRSGSAESVADELSDELDGFVRRALEKEPDERYPSVAKLRVAIENYLSGSSTDDNSAYKTASGKKVRTSAAAMRKTVAVLPLSLLKPSGLDDIDTSSLTLGLADAIITRLAKVRGLIVRPTSSITKYADVTINPLRAGRELKADHVVDGRLRRVGDRVRVSIQLLDVATGSAIWAGHFDEAISDVLDLEDRISEQVVKELAPNEGYSVAESFSEDTTLGHRDPATAVASDAPTLPSKRGFIRRHPVAITSVLVLFALVSVGYLTGVLQFSYTRNGVIGTAPAAKTIAILPFANQTGNTENDYLSDGITEDVISRLSLSTDITVISRVAAFRYKDKSVDPVIFGSDMKADVVIAGTVTKEGDDVIVTADMYKVSDRRTFGHFVFRSTSDAIAKLQDEISGKFAQVLGAGMPTGHSTTTASVNNDALDLYLKGEFQRQKGTPRGNKESIDLYKKAIEIDPKYALAYQGLTLAYRSAPDVGTMTPTDAYARAKESASKALSLDPSLSAPYVALASIKFAYDWDFDGAERQYKLALELQPKSQIAHFSYGNYLVSLGRTAEGLNEFRAALESDPLSQNAATGIAWTLYIDGRYDEAIEQIRSVIGRDPDNGRAYLSLGEIQEEQKDYAGAIASVKKAIELSDDPLAEMALGHIYAVSGKIDEAKKIAVQLEEQARKGESSPFLPAVVYAGLDEKDRAFYWLERSYQERSNWLTLLMVGRRLQNLHDDPRFGDLLQRIGFKK